MPVTTHDCPANTCEFRSTDPYAVLVHIEDEHDLIQNGGSNGTD